MKVYHGSIEMVKTPEIREPNRTLDYGAGFYATTSHEQALRFVQRRMREHKTDKGFIYVFELKEQLLEKLNFLSFDAPTEEWVDFVMQNRMQPDFTHSYDVVYGPVANDHVYAAFSLYEGHIIGKQTLITELRAYKLVDQYLFHTEKSLTSLTFIKAEEIK